MEFSSCYSDSHSPTNLQISYPPSIFFLRFFVYFIKPTEIFSTDNYCQIRRRQKGPTSSSLFFKKGALQLAARQEQLANYFSTDPDSKTNNCAPGAGRVQGAGQSCKSCLQRTLDSDPDPTFLSIPSSTLND